MCCEKIENISVADLLINGEIDLLTSDKVYC